MFIRPTCWKRRCSGVGIVPVLALFLLPLAAASAQGPSLPNGGFEAADAAHPDTAAGWRPYGRGYVRDAAAPHGGGFSLRCDTSDSTGTFGALCTLPLNQTVATPILLSGWSKASGVDGVTDNDYSLYVDVTYTDGTSLWGQIAPFDVGTHDWQRRRLTLFPTKPIRALNVYALFRSHAGTAWFDDFDARSVTSNALFDGQAVAPPVLSASQPSGWFVRDVAAGSPLVPLRASQTALGLRLDGLQTESGGRVVRGTLHNLTAGTRAVTVYYAERFPAAGPVWWNDIRSAVPALGDRDYVNLTGVNVGATGQLSLYPFGCVTGRGAGRTLGLPPRLGPRVARIGFHARSRVFYLACDLALTGRGDPSGHDRAPVAAARDDADPAWGFRDAARRFYALFPAAYQRRARGEGIWMPFTDPARVSKPQDFHFAYHEGDNSVVGDRAKGILSFRYVEPMTYWMPMPKDAPRTYDAALALVRSQAAGADGPASRQSQAVLTSGSQGAGGRLNVAFRSAPWCDGAVWVLNPDPRLPRPPDQWSKARLNAAGEPTPGLPDQPDGEYLDSLEAWADVLDYRPESLRVSAIPLTFTPDSFRPTLPTWFSVYEATQALSDDLHRRGKLLMANSTPWRFAAFAPLLDVLGTETNTFSNAGDWQPEPDAVQNLRRTLSGHKPYLLLLNTDFRKTDPAQMELYFQRCLFYGFYPSMFSANAADHPYWEDPRLPDRDRPLFEKYIPVIQRLSRSGWEPVTWAHTDRPDVWVERFGTQYLTVLNSGRNAADVSVAIDAARFAPQSAKNARLVVRDAMKGGILLSAPARGTVPVRLRLAASAVRVLSLQSTAARTTP